MMAQKQQQQQRGRHSMPATSSTGISQPKQPSRNLKRVVSFRQKSERPKLTSGNDFYDDGYCDEELDAEDITSQLDFDFFGRQQELAQLRKAYRDVVEGRYSQRSSVSTNTNSASNNSTPAMNEPKVTTPGKTVNAAQTVAALPATLVWGLSGTGKTKLVQEFVHKLKKEQGQSAFYFLQGKHDESANPAGTAFHPFSAIIQAIDDFCCQISNQPISERLRVSASVRKSLGGEKAKAMAKMVPSIRSLFDIASSAPAAPSLISDDDDDDSDSHGNHSINNNDNRLVVTRLTSISSKQNSAMISSSSSTSSDNTPPPPLESLRRFESDGSTEPTAAISTDLLWNRLQYNFVSFIQAIATKERPIIMCLDDLQWSSQVCLDLLTTILMLGRHELQYFFFIGTVRLPEGINPNDEMELDEDLPLSKMLTTLRDKHPNNHATPWTDVRLKNLSQQDVGDLLSLLLDTDAADLEPLPSKIYQRTHGNLFLTIELLEQLKRCNALVYCRISFQWQCQWPNEEDGQSALTFTENIVHLMTMKLKLMAPELQTALTIASYIKSRFDLSVLKAVIEQVSHTPMDNFSFLEDTTSAEALVELLGRAVSAGLLVEAQPLNTATQHGSAARSYRFAHDRVQQAARDLVPFGEPRNKLRQIIGKSLLELCQTSGSVDPGLLFVAADHCNSSPTKNHLHLVQLNLQVGEKAASMAALAQASAYLQIASNALRKVRDPWVEHYDLAKRLHSKRADVALSLNQYTRGYSISDDVLENTKTMDEKMPIYFSMATALGRQNEYKKSLDLAKSSAQTLGTYPKRSLIYHIVKETISLKVYFDTHSDEHILAIPLMTDPRRLLAMKFMRQISLCGHHARCLIDQSLGPLKIIRMSINEGISEDTAMGLATYGLIASILADQVGALRFANLAKQVLKLTKSRALVGTVQAVCCAYIEPWTEPANSIIEGFRLGHTASMELGDLEGGFNCWAGIILFASWEGYPISAISASYQSILSQQALYKISAHSEMLQEHADLALIMLKKKELCWEDIKAFKPKEAADERSDSQFFITGNWIRLHLAIYFFKFEIAEQFAIPISKIRDKEPMYQFLTSKTYYIGLMAAGRYRQTGKRKYLRQLRRAWRHSKSSCKVRGTTSLDRTLLLKAELNSLMKQHRHWEAVQDLYDEAIDFAAEATHVHQAGLGCELAGEYFLRVGQQDLASDYLTKAWGFYEQWGALAKIDDLRQRRAQYIHPERLGSIRIGKTGSSNRISNRPTYLLLHGTSFQAPKSAESVSGRESSRRQSLESPHNASKCTW